MVRPAAMHANMDAFLKEGGGEDSPLDLCRKTLPIIRTLLAILQETDFHCTNIKALALLLSA